MAHPRSDVLKKRIYAIPSNRVKEFNTAIAEKFGYVLPHASIEFAQCNM
jgi:hypothetical protein